ncbi:MAG: CBS domain-containing protein [Alphaproteobacteria bacterium]|nr:CBS domain-containing protein [Alphaproteobacteria bacterium]
MSVEKIIRAKKRPVVTLVPEAPVIEAAKLLAQHRIRLVMVVNSKEVFIGVVRSGRAVWSASPP